MNSKFINAQIKRLEASLQPLLKRKKSLEQKKESILLEFALREQELQVQINIINSALALYTESKNTSAELQENDDAWPTDLQQEDTNSLENDEADNSLV